MVQKYVQHALTSYPILYEPNIWEQVDRVLNTVGQMSSSNSDGVPRLQEHFDFLIVYLILAISTTLGAARSGQEARCFALSTAIFREGIQHLSCRAPFPNEIAGVQATLLILQYAFINPLCANVWILSGAAMRSCLELGLHREIRGGKLLDPLLIDLRRRVFWVAYVMDRSICSTLQRPLSIPDLAIDTLLPSVLDDYFISPQGLNASGRHSKLPALRWIEYSQLQSQMTEIHFQEAPIPGNQLWDEWLLEMETKLRAWCENATILNDLTQSALTYGLMSLH